MLDAISTSLMTIFFFQEDSAQVHCVQHNPVEWKMWFPCFPVLTGSAEAQVIWGGILKRLLIACFIGNICAKKHQNPFMCVTVIASQSGTCFETQCSTALPDFSYRMAQLKWGQLTFLIIFKSCNHYLRPKGHTYALPRCDSEIHKKSFVPRCLFKYI